MKSLYIAILVLLLAQSIFATQNKIQSRNKSRSRAHMRAHAKLRIKHRHRTHSSHRMKVHQDIPAIVYEGWLRIASETLIDPERYPDIPAKKAGKPAFPLQILGDKESDEDAKVLGENYDGVFRKNTQWLPDGSGIAPAIDAFYFRLSGHNLYYTETDADVVVLGAIGIHNLKSTKGGAPNCFSVSDDESDNWTLCTIDGAPTSDWICPISEVLGLPCPEEGEGEAAVQKVLVEQPLLIIPLPSPDCARDWNYNFHGANWVCKCNEGREQSPIDLPATACMSPVKVNADFDYRLVKKGDVLIVYHLNVLRFIPKHAKINMGKLTDVDGTEYQVSECLFHTPGEHTIMGAKFDAELQVIHKCIKGIFKQKAVMAVLYKRKPGAVVQAFEEMDILNLPNPLFREGNNLLAKDFHIMKFVYDDDQYNSPPPFDYYKYRGSFSFPPCEEDVIWFVLQDPIPIGTTSYAFLKDVPNPPKTKSTGKCAGGKAGAMTYADNFDGTNREVQPLRDREVFFYDRTKGCSPFTPRPKQPSGHYEKLEQKGMKYFFVDGDKPSGIPGALVVSQAEADGKVPPKRGSGDRFGVHE